MPWAMQIGIFEVNYNMCMLKKKKGIIRMFCSGEQINFSEISIVFSFRVSILQN